MANFRYIVCIGLAAILLVGCGDKKIQIDVDVNGKAAVIADAQTGEVLFQKNPDSKYPPASTVKLMTAVLAVENLPLDIDIVPSKKAVYVEPTVINLKPGVSYKLKDLIEAILIKSANDAARVIAEAVAGTEEEFAKMMNNKAAELGMENTYFVTSSGLPTGKKDKQYTTASDLIKLMRYARKYKVLLEAMSKKEEYIYGSDDSKIYLKTHNKALFKRDSAPWGKTGYTIEARRAFVGVDPSLRPKIVFAVLKTNELWSDIFELNDKGLEIYEEKNRTFVSDIIDWVKSQRQKGRERISSVLSAS
jgi:D-alanyl-D-alanine carboxypeptidase (penicillin-binding protein 5/6)